MPTSAWATGTIIAEVRRSSGGESRAMRIPKPIVTALVPSGTMIARSSARPAPRPVRAMTTAATPPTTTATTMARPGERAASWPPPPTAPRRARTSVLPEGAVVGQPVTVAHPEGALHQHRQRHHHQHQCRQQRHAHGQPRPGGPGDAAVGWADQAGSPAPARASSPVTTSTRAATATSCTRASAAAVVRSVRCVAARQISVSRVGWPGPPTVRITPNDVKQNRNTIPAALHSAGANRGASTSRHTRHRVAPSTRAASSVRGSKRLQ